MSELVERIRSRGYWKVIIRPSTFVENRVPHRSSLLPILQKTSVDFRGWSFPPVDIFLETEKGADWVGQNIDWEPHVELWRFYQSGQFVCYSGMSCDWDQHSQTNTGWPSQWKSADGNVQQVSLDIGEVIVRFTEMFEFAARLAFTDAGDDGIHVEVAADNFKGHFLPLPALGPERSRWRLPRSSEGEMQYTVDVTRTKLVAEARDLSLEPALELFRCFQWDPGIPALRDIQSELLSRRAATIR